MGSNTKVLVLYFPHIGDRFTVFNSSEGFIIDDGLLEDHR